MKSAYKGLRSKLKDNQNPRQFENGLKASLDKPRSAPNSPTSKRRPMTFRREAPISLAGSTLERPYSPLSPMSQTLSPDSPDHSQTGSPSLDIPKIDLMNEMKDILKLRLDTPPVDRSLKPVRSLENFKNSSPMSSPERWVFPARPINPPVTSPPTRLFLPTQKSQETQNLLLQSPDDVFSSPPVPPRPAKTRDIFGTAPFVVGGGHSENGHPVFLVANQHTVDVVRLSPPTNSPRRKKDEDTEDLIRLDSSSSDIDDFDPLKSSSTNSMPNNTFLQNFHLTSSHNQVPMSVTNPLYNYENHQSTPNGTVPGSTITRNSDRETVELLQEYGLDFQSFSRSKFDPFINSGSNGRDSSGKATSQNQWTKFE